MVKKPLYLTHCLYGIPFIVLGTAAGNAVVFGENIMLASGKEVNNGTVRAIALGVITFACFLHAISRSGGIWLNNIFGSIKFLMLLTLFIVGVAYSAGRFGGNNSVAAENLNVHHAFAGASTSSYGYAEAFLAIIFAIGGFNQANYVGIVGLAIVFHSLTRDRFSERSTIRERSSSAPLSPLSASSACCTS